MAIFLKCLIDCNFIATCKQKMIPLYFCLTEFYGHGTSDIMSAELCCLHGLESVVAGLTTKFRTKNKKNFLKIRLSSVDVSRGKCTVWWICLESDNFEMISVLSIKHMLVYCIQHWNQTRWGCVHYELHIADSFI